MNSRSLWIMIALAFALVIISFIANFHSRDISSDLQDWNNFGGFVGGTLGPLLSFLSIILLIKTLELQVRSSNSLDEEIKRTKKQDKLTTFESHFFNMLSAQKNNFDEFYLEFEGVKEDGVASANKIDDLIYQLKSRGGKKIHVQNIISKIDYHGSLFNAARIFYVICKIIEEHLSDSQGFDKKKRAEYYQTLIYFTDYALLRLICVYIVYYPETKIASNLASNNSLRVISKRSGLGKYISNITF